ncbi:MAG: glycosyltransferase family 4 protein, partial [Clostridia bacterium]|nr:glycosyltransferase family 4 protein [Clostridia bacterium]
LAGCAFLARLAGYSNIISHSHEIVSHYGILPKLLINLCVLSSHRVVCVSDAVKNDMLSSLIIKQKHKFIVVHNGIESQKYIPIEKSSKFQILLLGRIMHEKGQWFLLDSLKKMSDQILNQISVKIVGSPPPYRNHLLNELESYIHQLKMDNIVEIAHFLKNPAEIIQMSHICVVPSIMPDPFPTTVLEAMAFGRAVIATNNGGAKEIIKHGETGFLVRPNDTEGLAMIINALVSDVGLIERIGKKAFSFFNDYLTVEMFEKRFMRVISCE